jgi:hypothetical protein
MSVYIGTIESKRGNFPWKTILVLMAIIVIIYSASKLLPGANNQFNDCFNKSGINKVWMLSDKRFVRSCMMPDGTVLAQKIKLIYDENKQVDFQLEAIYSVESELDIPGLLLEVYPNPGPLEGFFKVVINLLAKSKLFP